MINFLNSRFKSFSPVASSLKEKTYKILDCIKTNGTQYIDTGVLAKNNLTIELDCYFTFNNATSFFGATHDGATDRVDLFYYQNNRIYYYYASSGYNGVSVNTSGRHIYKVSDNILYIDGVQKLNAGTSTAFTSDLSIYLFATNWNGEATRHSSLLFYGCKIWDNNILVREFIPVQDSNGIVCLYDKVESKFYYTNAGTFNSVKPAVELNYIQTTGSQAIRTDYIPNNNTKIEICTNVEDTTDIQVLFGSRRSHQDSDYSFWTAYENKGMVFGWGSNIETRDLYPAFGQDAIITAENACFTIKNMENNVLYTRTITKGSLSNAKPLILLAYDDERGVGSYQKNTKFYYCKIYENDVLMRHFIPVRDADGTTCIFDLVKQNIFYNIGTGNFVAGYKQ